MKDNTKIIEVLNNNFTKEEINFIQSGMREEVEGINIHNYPPRETFTLVKQLAEYPEDEIALSALKSISEDWKIVFTEGEATLREKQEEERQKRREVFASIQASKEQDLDDILNEVYLNK